MRKAWVVAAELLKMTTGLAIELKATGLGAISAGPGFTPRTQASAEPAADSQALGFAVLERRARSAPVSRLPDSSLSTPAYSLHGSTRFPDGASTH